MDAVENDLRRFYGGGAVAPNLVDPHTVCEVDLLLPAVDDLSDRDAVILLLGEGIAVEPTAARDEVVALASQIGGVVEVAHEPYAAVACHVGGGFLPLGAKGLVGISPKAVVDAEKPLIEGTFGADADDLARFPVEIIVDRTHGECIDLEDGAEAHEREPLVEAAVAVFDGQPCPVVAHTQIGKHFDGVQSVIVCPNDDVFPAGRIVCALGGIGRRGIGALVDLLQGDDIGLFLCNGTDESAQLLRVVFFDQAVRVEGQQLHRISLMSDLSTSAFGP